MGHRGDPRFPGGVPLPGARATAACSSGLRRFGPAAGRGRGSPAGAARPGSPAARRPAGGVPQADGRVAGVHRRAVPEPVQVGERRVDRPRPGLRDVLRPAADLLRRARRGSATGRSGPAAATCRRGWNTTRCGRRVRPVHNGRLLVDLGDARAYGQPEVEHAVLGAWPAAARPRRLRVEPGVGERAGVAEGVPPLLVRARRRRTRGRAGCRSAPRRCPRAGAAGLQRSRGRRLGEP